MLVYNKLQNKENKRSLCVLVNLIYSQTDKCTEAHLTSETPLL